MDSKTSLAPTPSIRSVSLEAREEVLFCGELVQRPLESSVGRGRVQEQEVQARWQSLEKAFTGVGCRSIEELVRCWKAVSNVALSSTCSSPISGDSPPTQCLSDALSQPPHAAANHLTPIAYRPSLRGDSLSDSKRRSDAASLQRAIFLLCPLAASLNLALLSRAVSGCDLSVANPLPRLCLWCRSKASVTFESRSPVHPKPLPPHVSLQAKEEDLCCGDAVHGA